MSLGRYPVLIKALFFIAAYLFHGRPFEGVAGYGYALLTAYLLLFGTVRNPLQLRLVVLGCGLFTVAHFIPQLAIPEQQRILMDNQQNLISPGQFLKEASKYPFFLTADGYGQGYKDKRFVRSLDIDNGIFSLRSGWVNRPEYNFFAPVSPHIRHNLPFVVCYGIVPEMAGMALTVDGLLVFGKEGKFKIHNPAEKTLQIQDAHVGSTLWGFGGQWDDSGYNNLTMKLKKPFLYKAYDVLRFCSFFASLGLLFLGLFSIRPTVDFGIQSLLLLFSSLSFWLYFPEVFRWGIFARGGMDGIIHDGFPYHMLEKWAGGNWAAALMSPESVFYFMPGMRYVRFAEMLLFGDAYIFQVCLILFVPVIFYRFFSVFLSRFLSTFLVFLSFFYFLDGMGLSLKMYIRSMLNLYGEGVAYALLLIALTMLAKSIQKVGWGAVAFFLMSISLSIRPNLAIFMGILGAIHLFTPTFSPLLWPSRFAMLFGLTPVLLIPLHNILGGEFVLLTKASQIPENLPLTPNMYYQALSHLLGFNETEAYTTRFISHFQQFYPQYALAWLGCFWLSFKGQTAVARSISLATFAGLSLHFFYLPDIRYLHPYLTIFLVLGLSQVPRLRSNFLEENS